MRTPVAQEDRRDLNDDLVEQAGEGTRLVFTEQGAFLDGHDVPAQREHGMSGLLDALRAEVGRGPTRH